MKKNMDIETMAARLELDMVEWYDVEHARAAFLAGDGTAFGACGYATHSSLELVYSNTFLLLERGIYEPSLVAAFVGCKHNNAAWPTSVLESMFSRADRDKLGTAGDPLPGPGPFTIFRGIAGSGAHARIRGLSWTLDLDTACSFALRSARMTATTPRVYTARVTSKSIYCYSEERGELEAICRPTRPKLLPLSGEDIHAASDRHTQVVRQLDAVAMAESQAAA